MSHDLLLKINGKSYGGWKSITVDTGMQTIASAFSLTASERWTDGAEPLPIEPGDECEVLIDGKLELTGYVDIVDTDYDDKTHETAIKGRSRSAELVDCSAAVKQYKKQTLLQIAKDIAKPFGIEVSTEVDIDAPIDDYVIGPGMTGFEVIESLAAHRAVMMMPDEKGNFFFTRATTSVRAPASLELGANIKAASSRRDHRDRYYTYKVVSQTKILDGWGGINATEPHAIANDPNIRKTRQLIINAENAQADLKDRAKWESNVRFGRSQPITYTVAGWGYDGKLWKPNTLVPVKDSFNQVNGERLIVHVRRILDDDAGQITEITVVPDKALSLIVVPLEKDSDGLDFSA